jgi:alkylation response protein AidB-like acyl-CoA dehydrogenase
MSHALSDEHRDIAALAGQIFADLATRDRVREVERSGEQLDRVLWGQLARAGLLGTAIAPEHGGAGLGLAELLLLLEQQGRHVAPVPLLSTLVLAALPVAAFGTSAQRAALLPGIADGSTLATAVLPGPRGCAVSAVESDGGTHLTGVAAAVPLGHLAHWIVVAAATRTGPAALFVVHASETTVSAEPVPTTGHQPVAHLTFDGARGERLGGDYADAAGWLVDRAHAGVAALHLGVADAALRQAAEYVGARHQFGRPLGSFQAVAHQLADAYVDTQAMRATLRQAAERLAAGADPGTSVLVARWWASEAGERVAYAVQHVHGGIGADIDYPVHRYFLWSRQLAQTFGGASQHLARLGDTIVGPP